MGSHAMSGADANRKWRRAALILGTIVLSFGCSPLSTLSFLMPGDTRTPPECPLVSKDKKEVKIVVTGSCTGLDARPETYGAEHDLAERLIQILKKSCAEDREKVTFVPYYQVRSYQNKATAAQTPYEVGKHFQADKVINLEVGPISLYKEGSAHQLFYGRIELSLTCTDMSKPQEEGPVFRQEYIQEYPRRGEIPADGSNPAFFRAHFLDYVARDLGHFFMPYDEVDRKMAPE
jgi:hypothetical protein